MTVHHSNAIASKVSRVATVVVATHRVAVDVEVGTMASMISRTMTFHSDYAIQRPRERASMP